VSDRRLAAEADERDWRVRRRMHTPGGALTVVMCMTLRVNMLDAGC